MRNIANNMKQVREAAGRRQEDVALAARLCGFGWQRSTVAMLESGRYELKATELLALPKVLLDAGVGDVTLRRLLDGPALPVHKGSGRRWVPVAVTDRLAVDRSDLGHLLGRKASTVDWGTYSEGTESGGPNEAERRAAKRLGVAPDLLKAIADGHWGRTLEEERDARVSESAPGGATARTLQALRAHTTRALLAELAAEMNLERENN